MWRTIAALSALWCVLIVVPALIAARVLAQSAPGTVKAWVLGSWIVGYVAQFVVFLAISRRSPRSVLLGWFVASIVPWAADWTAPVSLWWLVLWAAVAIGYATWLVVQVSRVDRLRAGGQRGTGVVLAVIRPTFNVVATKDSSRRVLRLRVESADGSAAYEARLTATFTLGEIPEPDDRVAVRIDPARPDHIELIEDEPLQRACPPPADLDPEVADQLRKLTTMRDRGDLTDAEFATARKRLLDW